MKLTLSRKDIKKDSRNKGNIHLTISDFNIPCIAIYHIDSIVYKDGSFERKFKTERDEA